MSNPLLGTQFKRKKYGNNPMSYNGSWYQSTKEGKHAMMLDTMKKAHNPAQKVERWEKQVKVELDAYGKHICNMYVDFRVWFADGHDEWHEIKSSITETPLYKIKEKMFRAKYPKHLYIVFKY